MERREESMRRRGDRKRHYKEKTRPRKWHKQNKTHYYTQTHTISTQTKARKTTPTQMDQMRMLHNTDRECSCHLTAPGENKGALYGLRVGGQEFSIQWFWWCMLLFHALWKRLKRKKRAKLHVQSVGRVRKTLQGWTFHRYSSIETWPHSWLLICSLVHSPTVNSHTPV